MRGKVVDIPVSPRRDATRQADEAWIRGEDPGAAGRPVKRVTFEVDEPMHRRLKVGSAQEGLTMSAFLRRLVKRALPE